MAGAKVKGKGIGVFILTALVAGNMIGSGVFLLPSALAKFGSISIVAWILTALGAVMLALVFARLSMWIPKVGGPYAYCRAGFGDFVGFQIAYNYWIALWVGNAAIIVGLVGYSSIFWPELGTDHVTGFIYSIAVLWLFTAINIIGVRFAGIVQVIATILKILPLLLIACVGIFFMHPTYLENFNVSGSSNLFALSGAATLTLWSFIGLESATVPADAVRDPRRTIPRATIIGTVISAIIYIFSTIAVMGTMHISALQVATAPYADAARIMFGSWGGWFVAAGAVISCLGALNGWTLLAGQIPYAAAQDKLFPKSFTKRNRAGAPVVGLVVSSILITLLLLLTLKEELVKQFTIIILLATLASLIPYFFTALAELMLLIRVREQFSKKRFTISATVAILATAYAFWAIMGSGLQIVYYGALLFFSSVPVYVWMQWRYRAEEIESFSLPDVPG